MARSLHRTRRSLDELEATDFSDGEARDKRLEEAREELETKRQIKRSVLGERHREPSPLRGTPLSEIPIELLDEGPNVLHAATPEDLRAVLRLLPAEATDGIARIQLSLATAYHREQATDEDAVRDPWFGRPGAERMPGVWSGDLLGTRFDSGLIGVYAYAWDPARLVLPRAAGEVYFKLRALMTLAHEIAHHHDAVARVARGRWRFEEGSKVERYANRMAHAWTRELILPWMEKTYPVAVSTLRGWVAETSGLELPFAFFAGDKRRFAPDSARAFETWCGAIAENPDPRAALLEFARWLQYADQYGLSLQPLERLRRETPADVELRCVTAHCLVWLDRYGEAMEIADGVLADDPTNSNAWSERARVLEYRHEWEALLETCARWRAAGASGAWTDAIRFRMAVAYCALGRRLETLKMTVAMVRRREGESVPRWNERGRKMLRHIFRVAGRPPPVPVR
jgi:tetratricopeptide (TPR) repeat protein